PDDADTVKVLGIADIARCHFIGGDALGGEQEDNASALRVGEDEGDTGIVHVVDTTLDGPHSTGGVSYGLLNFGSAFGSRLHIDGGVSEGLFAIGVRNKP